MGPAISDYNMRLILLSVIQLSGGHCTNGQLKTGKMGTHLSANTSPVQCSLTKALTVKESVLILLSNMTHYFQEPFKGEF